MVLLDAPYPISPPVTAAVYSLWRPASGSREVHQDVCQTAAPSKTPVISRCMGGSRLRFTTYFRRLTPLCAAFDHLPMTSPPSI